MLVPHWPKEEESFSVIVSCSVVDKGDQEYLLYCDCDVAIFLKFSKGNKFQEIGTLITFG